MKLVLANRDYGPEDRSQGWGAHMTSEGMELQLGFEANGWMLVGAGYGDGLRNVPALIERYRPSIVLCQDRRDFDPQNAGCFNKHVGFALLGALASEPDIYKVAVIKDAGSMVAYHRYFAEEIGADALLTYYHDRSVERCAPWMADYRLIRTYHTVDRFDVEALDLRAKRKRALISGAANSEVYPLRWYAMHYASSLGLDVLRHPGYGNRGCHTPEYLRTLAGYRVHIATASRYGFALRKIIESVACGTTPVTNLPEYDRLPGIDGALVRVSSAATMKELSEAIREADGDWNLDERLYYSEMALDLYDYRSMTRRTATLIEQAQVEREAANVRD